MPAAQSDDRLGWRAVVYLAAPKRRGSADSDRSPDDGQPSQVDPKPPFGFWWPSSAACPFAAIERAHGGSAQRPFG